MDPTSKGLYTLYYWQDNDLNAPTYGTLSSKILLKYADIYIKRIYKHLYNKPLQGGFLAHFQCTSKGLHEYQKQVLYLH